MDKLRAAQSAAYHGRSGVAHQAGGGAVVTPGRGPNISSTGPIHREPMPLTKALRIALPIIAGIIYLTTMLTVVMPPVSLILSTIFYAALVGTCIVYSRTLS